ncbi:MAG: hypothetical protein HQ581_26650 [Planctomycetes bacterium]|nr:hypothetical protein [Planctomycetota bacterium]
MSLLRITQTAIDGNRYRADLRLEDDGAAPLEAASEFEFRLTAQDEENLRWYLEDFLQYPHDPAPTIAAKIEQRIVELGTELFRSVFQKSDDARDLWAVLRGRLDETRVEVVTSVSEATSIPWELIRDPKTDVPLALRAATFVRAQPEAAQRGEVRVKLGIRDSNPEGGDFLGLNPETRA